MTGVFYYNKTFLLGNSMYLFHFTRQASKMNRQDYSCFFGYLFFYFPMIYIDSLVVYICKYRPGSGINN